MRLEAVLGHSRIGHCKTRAQNIQLYDAGALKRSAKNYTPCHTKIQHFIITQFLFFYIERFSDIFSEYAFNIHLTVRDRRDAKLGSTLALVSYALDNSLALTNIFGVRRRNRR